MLPPFRSCTLALSLLVLLGFSAEPARAALLWYNGDYDNRDALANGTAGINYNGPFLQVSRVYENFIVPVGQTWTITSVFSNNQIDYFSGAPITTASWQIRSGVGAGNGGTLVASNATAAATTTSLAQVPGYYYIAAPVQVTATVAPLVLTAGTYWLSVIANDATPFFTDQSYVMTTSGLNSVGRPPGNDGNSFISNNLPAGAPGSYSFTPTSAASVEGAGTWDYSMGVSGTASVVPEPSSLILVAIGGLATSAFLRRRSREGAR